MRLAVQVRYVACAPGFFDITLRLECPRGQPPVEWARPLEVRSLGSKCRGERRLARSQRRFHQRQMHDVALRVAAAEAMWRWRASAASGRSPSRVASAAESRDGPCASGRPTSRAHHPVGAGAGVRRVRRLAIRRSTCAAIAGADERQHRMHVVEGVEAVVRRAAATLAASSPSDRRRRRPRGAAATAARRRRPSRARLASEPGGCACRRRRARARGRRCRGGRARGATSCGTRGRCPGAQSAARDVEPVDALASAALHLHHVGHGMHGPAIRRLSSSARRPVASAASYRAAFLEPERVHAEHDSRSPACRARPSAAGPAPTRSRSMRRVAQEEIPRVRRSAGPAGRADTRHDDVAVELGGTGEIAFQPCASCRSMHALAFIGPGLGAAITSTLSAIIGTAPRSVDIRPVRRASSAPWQKRARVRWPP